MKKLFVRLLLIGLIFGSCHKTNEQNSQTANAAITSGSWRVTLFTDSGNDETSDFSGYTFIFGSDGVINASKGTNNITGAWSKSSKFNIDLGPKNDNNKPLGELTDDWHIISTDASHIILGDDNESSDERLSFTKN